MQEEQSVAWIIYQCCSISASERREGRISVLFHFTNDVINTYGEASLPGDWRADIKGSRTTAVSVSNKQEKKKERNSSNNNNNRKRNSVFSAKHFDHQLLQTTTALTTKDISDTKGMNNLTRNFSHSLTHSLSLFLKTIICYAAWIE